MPLGYSGGGPPLDTRKQSTQGRRPLVPASNGPDLEVPNLQLHLSHAHKVQERRRRSRPLTGVITGNLNLIYLLNQHIRYATFIVKKQMVITGFIKKLGVPKSLEVGNLGASEPAPSRQQIFNRISEFVMSKCSLET
ncbi:hypothetical protein AgCh_005483 [Apium graveolens]